MWNVEVSYNNSGLKCKLDDPIIKLFKKSGGNLAGSGCCLWGDFERDLIAEFPNLSSKQKSTLETELRKIGCKSVEFSKIKK